MVKKRKVVWDEEARASLKEAYLYIRQDSIRQAEKVKNEIIEAAKRLADYPEMHPPDKYRRDKIFAFVLLKNIIIDYRISLEIHLFESYEFDM